MGSSKPRKFSTDEVIAAFDREREEAQALRRRHAERLRALREQNRSVHEPPRRKS